MVFKRAKKADIDNIIEIIQEAQVHLKKQEIDQWQNNYPNRNTIKNDIKNGYGYVLLKDQVIVATVAVIFSGEKTYDTIHKGSWITNGRYAVIHRIAVSPMYHGQGLASEIIKQVEGICLNKKIKSIKIDTHRKNISMQKLLLKNEFHYCGIIYLEDGAERMAFEKVIKGH